MKQYQESVFGEWQNQEVRAYRFENDLGYQLSVMTYGATILEYVTPDKEDRFANIILGFDRFEDYVGNSPKYGASIGPVAGRISGASFELNGETYYLEANNGANCNHSGSTGWDSALFSVESVTDQEITLYTERADGTGGFPGNLKIWVTYGLTEDGELEIGYRVETDQDTLVNPTIAISTYLGTSPSRLMTMSFRSTIKGFTLSIQTASLFRPWIEKARLFSISIKLCSWRIFLETLIRKFAW